MMRTITTYS